MKLKHLAATALVALTLLFTGCKTPDTLKDGYQFGDVTATIADLHYRYCTEGDQTARVLLVTAIHLYVPGYPTEGVCTDLVSLLADLERARAARVSGESAVE